MEKGNHTSTSAFILLGLSSQPERQELIFGLFLVMYLIGAAGNLLIILAIVSDSHLHTPMYFFLSNLSLVDFCFISATVPKMLVNIQMQTQFISYGGCLTQIYFCILLANMDNFLLTAMAYDRYVAICHPLHYSTMMSLQICALTLGSSWLIANFHSLLHTLLMARLEFCASNVIPYFFCDLVPLLQLSCSNTQLNQLMILLVGGLIVLIPFVGILISYVHIVSAVLKVPSARGKQKAFSTCGSHLTVVILFYGTITGVYLNPSSSHSADKDSLASIMYMVVTPMLNPFIYCLRNKDVKRALRKLFTVKALSCGLWTAEFPLRISVLGRGE
ncbi:PREDICTED: olfactory receptor 1361 [Myotis davidii]|uniref:Olfactory receptor n=1 Tax=Myotis davidii TaxID=225400 RepID=L5MEG5_MYODS|nr:PREDICTED: olfactory receptor 1361 [Myotis davidii]ELK36732.1 Olfactory receptor 1F12 [Myotis davidii]